MLGKKVHDGVDFESLLAVERTRLTVRRKIVDASNFSHAAPATHTPAFAVGAGVRVVPPGALPGLWRSESASRLPGRSGIGSVRSPRIRTRPAGPPLGVGSQMRHRIHDAMRWREAMGTP